MKKQNVMLYEQFVESYKNKNINTDGVYTDLIFDTFMYGKNISNLKGDYCILFNINAGTLPYGVKDKDLVQVKVKNTFDFTEHYKEVNLTMEMSDIMEEFLDYLHDNSGRDIFSNSGTWSIGGGNFVYISPSEVSEFFYGEFEEHAVRFLKSKGYDSVYMKDGVEGRGVEEIIGVFDINQIIRKS